MGIGSPLTPVKAAVSGAGAIVHRLDRVLSSIETLAGHLGRIEDQMAGMRADIESLNEGVQQLRHDVQRLGGSVSRIGDATVGLELTVDGLQDSLRRIDALAARVPGARRRARAAAE